MPEPVSERVFIPSRGYDLKMIIKDLDYSSDLISVRIISSLSTAYQNIFITIFIDPNDIILDDVFGKEPIKLTVTLLGQDEIPGDSIDFELMYLTSKFMAIEKTELSEEIQKDRVPLEITTVCGEPFKTMSTYVNKIYSDTTIEDVINGLVSETDATVKIDSDGINSESIDQVCIPPSTLYKIIKEYNSESIDPFDGFLDQRFGLFDGIPGIFCQHDNVIYIKNLTEKMKKAQAFTVYQLSQSGEDKEIIEKSIDGENFYTYANLSFHYSGNAKFAVISPTIKHIVKPKDALYSTIEQNLSDICSNYGLIDGDDKMDIDPKISSSKRITYHIQDTGNESVETQFNSRISRMVSDLNSVSLNLERNLPILNLMEVGECVKLNTQITEYIDLAGKYILWSSDLNFGRHGGGEFQATATINLVRTNKKIGQKD